MDRLDAVIFDLDGVITDTASVHAAAWKRMFDQFLADRADREGEDHQPFSADDYHLYVDGKPRYDGVESFLASRGISLPRGEPGDPPAAETVCGLGNRKDELFLSQLREEGVAAFPSSVELLHRLRASGCRTAIISASRNCAEVLEAAGVAELFDAKVDGVDADELGLNGQARPGDLPRGGETARRRAGPRRRRRGRARRRRGRAARRLRARDRRRPRLATPRSCGERGADIVVGDLGELRVVGDDGKRRGERPGRRGRRRSAAGRSSTRASTRPRSRCARRCARWATGASPAVAPRRRRSRTASTTRAPMPPAATTG